MPADAKPDCQDGMFVLASGAPSGLSGAPEGRVQRRRGRRHQHHHRARYVHRNDGAGYCVGRRAMQVVRRERGRLWPRRGHQRSIHQASCRRRGGREPGPRHHRRHGHQLRREEPEPCEPCVRGARSPHQGHVRRRRAAGCRHALCGMPCNRHGRRRPAGGGRHCTCLWRNWDIRGSGECCPVARGPRLLAQVRRSSRMSAIPKARAASPASSKPCLRWNTEPSPPTSTSGRRTPRVRRRLPAANPA